MHPLFVLGLVFAGVTAALMPYYCKITYPGKSKKTLIFKMILSSLFLLTAILAMFSHNMRHGYMYILLLGFVMCYIGDYILGKDERTGTFVAGSCCFAVGHILYAVAFSLAQKNLFPQLSWWNGFDIGVFAAIVCLMLLIIVIKKPAFDPMFCPMFVYCLIVALMATKATGLAVRTWATAPAMLLAPIGALCFLYSDFTLGMLRFKMHKKTVLFKSACTASYYVAQMLLALSAFTLIRL